MPKQNKIQLIKKLIDTAQDSIAQAKSLLAEMTGQAGSSKMQERAKEVGSVDINENEKIVEGVFDGQSMIGPDGKEYSIPANYASKSKLVEGDVLKLTIMPDGSFVYKQISPVERDRKVGTLIKDETTGDFKVLSDDKTYNVLFASVTYYKGGVGDEAVILAPREGDSTWAAVENVIKK
ncbi:MAG: hypothetical protein U5L76_00785 [Patescibacteria group bacterium]|nr:hypothetical protein [Patescibacteria group bacterium]